MDYHTESFNQSSSNSLVIFLQSNNAGEENSKQ